MAKYLPLPDGTSVTIREGETPQDAWARAQRTYPEAFGVKPSSAEQPRSGFTPALKSGYSELKAGIAALAGRTGIMDEAAAEKYIKEQEAYQQRTFKPTATFGEAPVTKTLELLGGSLPYVAAPVVAGGAVALAPISGTAATIAGLGAAGAASAGQFTGSNLRRQMEEGTALGQTELAPAFAAALPQAALDMVSFRMMPGIRQLFTAAGKEVTPAVAKRIAEQGVKEVAKDYTLATGKSITAEGLTEVGQQVLERMQAGLSLTDEKARAEYIDSLIGGAVLGGVLSPAGRYVERRGEAKKQEQALLESAKELRQQEDAAREAEKARRATPEGQREFVQEYEARLTEYNQLKALKKPGKDSDPLEQVEFKDSRTRMGELRKDLTRDAVAYRTARDNVAKLTEEARLQGMSPEEFMLEQMGLDKTRAAAPAAAPKMRMMVDEFGQISEVPEGAEETAAPPLSAVEQYVAQQTEAAKQAQEQSQIQGLSPEGVMLKQMGLLPAEALTLQNRVAYLLADPVMANQIVKTRTPMPDLSKKEANALYDALELQLKEQARQEMAARDAELRGQLPQKPPVGQRKAPNYDAYLEALDELDFARREGDTEAEVRAMEKLRRSTEVIDQGELFGETASKTVLGQAPKTRRELLADLRVARAAGDNKAGLEVIDALRKLDDAEASRGKFQTGTAPEFRLTGEQRQRLFESGMTEEQIDETESRAQKAIGQNLGANETPMSVAMQQMASESRAEAFAEIVDLVNRFNKGAAKREQLAAAQERLISGLITDIQQTRGRELADNEKQDITRNAGILIRELIERFGDTRNLSQKGKDTLVSAQTSTGEFTTGEVPGAGFPTVESRAPGQQTFGSPFAAVQSIREGLEELRSQAIAGDTMTFSRTYTPRTVSADAVETQLSRELAKDPKSHSKEQRNLLEAIADNLRMMLRPETRQDVSDWLYDLARDAKNVSPERTQAVRDALRAVEQAKRSETEIVGEGEGKRVERAAQPELPLGPGRELRRTELAGPQKPAPAGTFSQISTAPGYEQATSKIFNSYAELERYLASDALQQIRSAIGLGIPTLARLQARIAPFMTKINAARAKADELSKQAQEIENRKRQELELLKGMTAEDMAAETLAMNQAKQQLDEAKKRLAELEAPLLKELAPLIKDFEKAKQQFENAVVAQEQTIELMLRNRAVFENREIAAIEKLQRVQRRISRARSKLYAEITEDFGNDPRNLARMMKEYKESGKQGAFAEQLIQAHKELEEVFFNTRKDDAAIQRFLQQAFKLDRQLETQGVGIDNTAQKLLNAGLALEVVRDSKVDIAGSRDEILDARAQTQEAQRRLAALEAQQQERIAALRKIEDELGLDRQEIPHRISEDTSVAEVLRASTDAEKELIQQLEATLAVANESSPAVRALRAFERNRERARAVKPETPVQTKARDAQRQRLLEAIGRDPASFEGQRISTEKRRDLAEEMEATEETRANLEAVIAAVDEAVPGVKERIAKAEKELKALDAEIAKLEALAKKKPRGFYAKLEQKSALTPLPFLKETRDKLAKSLKPADKKVAPKDRVVHSLVDELARWEAEKATAQSNLATLDNKTDDLTALFSNDPEISNAVAAGIDKRIAKVETNIRNNAEGINEKGISKKTRESRERELRKYRKELRELMTKRSAKFGITRTELSSLAPAEAQPVEAGERLGVRKVGPLVVPTRTAGNVRTGELETAEERKLSTRSKITQSGKAKTSAPIAPVEEAATVEDRILGELDGLERVRQTLETRVLDSQAANDNEAATGYKETMARVDAQIAAKQAELEAARTAAAKPAKRKKKAEPAVEPSVLGAKEVEPFTKPEYLTVDTLPDSLIPSIPRLLTNEQIAALEQVYKAERGSDKFARSVKLDVVNYINSGAQSLARDARTPIKQLADNAGLERRQREVKEITDTAGPARRPRVVYRTVTPVGKGVDPDALATVLREAVSDWANVPTIVVARDFDALPNQIKQQAIADGMQDILPGLYDPNTNTAYFVATNIGGKQDALATLAHEVAGHYGLRAFLGGTYAKTMNDIYNGNASVRAKADAKLAENPALGREIAVEEVLADMAEVAPAEQTPDTRSALRKVYDAIKAWFATNFKGQVSDAAVQQIVANARRYVIQGGTAAQGTIDTSRALYRTKARYANPEMARMGEDTDKFVAKQRGVWEKIKMNSTGLAFATQLVDRFAGFERLAKYMDSLKGSQMLYYLRMYDQRMNFVSQAVGNGAPQIVEKTRADGRKEYVIETKPGANIKNVVEILRKAQPMVGNAEAVNRAFTMYLAALRAQRVGLAALNFGPDVNQRMLDDAINLVERTPGLKRVFDEARAEYNAYNRDLMKFLASTGAISERLAERLASTNDYIPFYREQDGNAMLIIGGEAPFRIGNIAEQPYLQELVGGDTAILDFLNSSVQNTNMLVDMGLRNLSTKNAVFELVNLNAAKLVRGRPAGPDVVKFKVDGEDRYAVVDTETVTVGGTRFNTGVPAELLVKGMEGIPTQMPIMLRAMALPAQLLRKAVTLSPMYMAKQLFRDSLAAPIVSGANFTPVFGAIRQIKGSAGKTLEERGITGGQYLSGTNEDIAKILRDIASGKPGFMTAISKLEAVGMEADALTRRAQYNSYIAQGLSEMEATLMALESMNFNKRGASPSVHMANALIPFFNAQIQGLNVLYKAFTGQMPFNDKLKIQQKLLMRGAMIAVTSLIYAAMMEDDEAYQNATPDQKYGNWFVRIPGLDEPVRLPVPFEIGYIFKGIPEALYNTMTKENGGEEAVKAFRQILLQTIPGGSSMPTIGGVPVPIPMPQALKPAIEAGLGKSFYTGRDILSAREKELLPEEQFRANTAEISKDIGKALGISPVTMEYLVRGYTGTLGLAFLHTLSLGSPKSESPEAAVKRLSEYPLVGGTFQPNDAGGIINAVYERFNEDIKVRNTYKKMLNEGRSAEANELLQRRGNEIMEAEIGDRFKTNMTKLTQAERAIAASGMSAEEKRAKLDEIRRLKTSLAKMLRDVADKTIRQQPQP
jgi:hypothetical protein